MAEEVFFSHELWKFFETEAAINMIAAFAPDEDTKQLVTKLFRAFAKRGVSAMTVVAAFSEMMEGFSGDGDCNGH